MSRISPIHYIAPSAISVTANANGLASDIAVYVARNTHIQVYCPKAGIGIQDSSYWSWVLTGRNRRLADNAKPYTIYARLPKSDSAGGYLVFAPKVWSDGQWVDKYVYVTPDGYADLGEASVKDDDNWYVRLGDVSIPENGQRTLTVDTGILGTDEFNTEWALDPDALPLRIELGCTVNDEDAGPTPYVYWGQTLMLTAGLVEGWTGTDIQRFDHWEITRDSGVAAADTAWNAGIKATAFRTSGSIALQHLHGVVNGDDFNGAVNATFTITAMERTDDPEEGGTPQYAPLETVSINIMAETVEKYELVKSADIVSYDPRTGTYTPAANVGVNILIRATDQRGDVFELTKGQYDNSGLVASYAPVGSDSWTTLAFTGSTSESIAKANIPISAFQSQQSINVRLVNGEDKELSRSTIAFVRDGEDSKEREWIFLRSATAITFGDASSDHPLPSLIAYGEVNPTGAAGHVTNDKNQDGWVPEGWWDDMQGTEESYPYEYGAYRDYVQESGNTPAHWGDFTTPRIWSHYGKDGMDAATLTLTPSVLNVPATSAGTATQTSFTIGTQMTVNGAAVTISSYQITKTQASNAIRIDTQSGVYTQFGITLLKTGKAHYEGEITVKATGTLNGKTYSATAVLPVVANMQGDAGDDAWVFTANPANVIITQSLGSDPTQFSTSTVSFVAKKGGVTAAISSIGTPTWHHFIGSVTGNTVTVEEPDQDDSDNYFTEGYFTVQVNATAPDGTTSSQNVTVPCYANLLGTWKETVEADVKHEVATAKFYFEDENGNVVAHETIGDYIKSSTENISTLQERTLSPNLFPDFAAGGWQSNGGDTTSITYTASNNKIEDSNEDLFSPVVRLKPNTTYCFSAHFDDNATVLQENTLYALMPASEPYQYNSDVYDQGTVYDNLTWNSVSGTTRKYFTFTTPNDGEDKLFVFNYAYDNCYLYKPQIELGSTPTIYNPNCATAKTSEISQTVDAINLSITNKLGATGIHINGTSQSIDLIAGKVNFLLPNLTAAPISIDAVTGTLTTINMVAQNATVTGQFENVSTNNRDKVIISRDNSLHRITLTTASAINQDGSAATGCDYDLVIGIGRQDRYDKTTGGWAGGYGQINLWDAKSWNAGANNVRATLDYSQLLLRNDNYVAHLVTTKPLLTLEESVANSNEKYSAKIGLEASSTTPTVELRKHYGDGVHNDDYITINQTGISLVNNGANKFTFNNLGLTSNVKAYLNAGIEIKSGIKVYNSSNVGLDGISGTVTVQTINGYAALVFVDGILTSGIS